MGGLVEALKEKGVFRSWYTEFYVDDEEIIGQYKDYPRRLAEEILYQAFDVAQVIFGHTIKTGYTVILDLRGLKATIYTDSGPIITVRVVLHYKPGGGLNAVSIFQDIR